MYTAKMCFRLRNDLYCVGWGVKRYSLTHSAKMCHNSVLTNHILLILGW